MKKLIFRLEDEDFTAFRVKLAREGRTAQDVLQKAVVDYLAETKNPKEGKEMKKWYAFADEEFNSPTWWGEINYRINKGDPFALKLREGGVKGTKKEIMEIVNYAKSIDGYYDGDERAPEALLYGEVTD